jgi:mannose-6-phosphate isomerase-like protein (cupin superfamily)
MTNYRLSRLPALKAWPLHSRRLQHHYENMIVQNLSAQTPFTTKDGSTIRSILDRTNAPVQNQSLAEARVPAGGSTQRHYHKIAEELYFILEGSGEVELDGHVRTVAPGDAILIPPGAWHTISAVEPLRFLCCCAPPYAHEDTYFA